MKRKEHQISIVLAAALFAAVLPPWTAQAEMAGREMEGEVLCEECQSPMTDGFCANTAVHADGIVLEAAELLTDPDSQLPAYEIENAGQLAWFVRELGAGSLTTSDAYLANDIDWEAIGMAGIGWTPIGNYVEGVSGSLYTGVFNGNGYELSGLSFADTESGIPVTVFGTIGSGAVVKELGLAGIEVSSKAASISVLAPENQGWITDCYINESTIYTDTEGAVVSDIAGVNAETGVITNCYSAVSVMPGMKADQSGTVTLAVRPVCGENLNLSNPQAIDNNYYLQTEDSAFDAMVSPVSAEGIEGQTAAVFESGSVAWKLNDGRTEAVFGQTLAEGAFLPGFFHDESYTDAAGIWVEVLLNQPVHQVTLDYTDLEDVYYYVNDWFGISNLPADTFWEIINEDGTVSDVTGDLEVLTDLTISQKAAVCQHEVVEVRDTVAATCTTPGTRETYCVNCGVVLGTEAITGDHVWGEYQSRGDATCTADGTMVSTCTVCGAVSEPIPNPGSALGHSFTTYVSDGNATCQADGTKTAACDNGCGTVDTLPDEGSKTDHVFTTYAEHTPATCRENQTQIASCDYGCGTTDIITIENSMIGHSFTVYVSDGNATCTADGTKTAQCDYGCGATETLPDEGSKLEHSFTEYVSNNDATCTADGTETASCDRGCGETHTRTDEGSRLEHSFTEYVSNNDATCTADGTETASCAYGCGETHSRTVEGSRLDHKYETYEYNNDATCHKNGTETAVCVYGCGTQDTKEKAGTKLIHSYTTYEYNNDATCQKDGTETAKCDHGCGETDTRTKAGTKVDHSYGEFVYNNDAGCMKNGTQTAECIFGCGESITEEALGTIIPHKFEQYVYNEDATCQVNGTETAMCAYGCGTMDTRDVTDESKIVPHKFEEYTYNNDATCTKNGSETAYCIYECGTTDTREVEGTQKDHTFADGVCTVCGASDGTWIADDVKATAAETNRGQNGWYRGKVTLNAPEGCYINTKNTEDFGTASSVTVEVTNGVNNITYYLRRGNGKIVQRTIQISADLTAPTGSVAVGNFVSTQAVTEIIFETYFNTVQTVKIAAQDDQSGMQSIEYLVSDKALAQETLQSAVWVTWSDSIPVKLEKESSYVIYVKLTDKAGNTAIINTNGLILDMTAPKIEGVINGSSICPETEVTVTDKSEVTVTLNQEAVVLEKGKLILTTPGSQTLRAVDKAGNQNTIIFSVKADHTWDAGQVQKEATCTEAGLRLDTCTLCGATRTEEIPMTEHVYTNYVYNEDATCQADGTKTALCDYGCNTADTIPAEGTKTDHKFTNYVYNEDATCQADGTKTALCDYGCNTADTIPAEGTKTDHKFTNYVYNQDATCKANGTKTALCDYGCNTADTVIAEGSMTGHKFTNYVYNNDATCKADGTKTAACDYGCGTKDTVTAPETRLAHTYGTDHICVICKEVDPAAQTTASPSDPNVPVLGIEDFGGIWGIVLISAGVIILVIVGVVFAAGRKRR